MRIAVISSQVFSVPIGGYGGLEVIAYECAKGLAQKGHEVALFAPDGSSCPGVQIVSTGPAGRISEKRAYSQYWQFLPQFDVIVCHDWNKYAYLLKGEGKLPKTQVLGVLHAPVNTMLSSMPPNVEKPCFVCISEDQKNHFESLFSPAKARVCYNGVDTEFYKPIEGVKRTDRFLFLARFSRIKGAAIALRTCLEAGVGLDLIGDEKITNEPEYLAECKKLAEQSSPNWDHSKGKQLRIIGGVSRGECVWYFSQAHAFLHSAKEFREPFGLSPVEAMLCKTPVISFNNGAMRETVGSRGGVVVDSEQKFTEMVKMFHSPSELQSRWTDKARTDCREWAKKFSVENMVSRYEELCVEAVETGGW